MRRALDLEGRLARAIEPILRDAGRDAATRFERHAVDHLTAAAAPDRVQVDTALLAAAGPVYARRIGMFALTAAPGVTSTSTMVCVKPRPGEAERLAELSLGALPPEELHVTLCFLGDIDGDLGPVAERLARVAGSHGPLAGAVGGIGAFGGDETRPSILLPSVPGLVELRVAVSDALVEGGFDYSRDYGYVPHMTVAYHPPADGVFPSLGHIGEPLHFDELLIVRGDVVEHTLPLTGATPLTAAGDRPPWTPPASAELVDADAIVGKLRGKTDPIRQAAVETTMRATLDGVGIDFDVTNPYTQKVLAHSGEHVTHVADTTRVNVARIVTASYEEGLSIPATAKAIRQGMAEASGKRATLIARTELVGAVNGGSLAATQIVADVLAEDGVGFYKVWNTATGAEWPRHETYDGLNGQSTTLDGTFSVGGSMLHYPGDPAGSVHEIANCRCALSYDERKVAVRKKTAPATTGAPALPPLGRPPAPIESPGSASEWHAVDDTPDMTLLEQDWVDPPAPKGTHVGRGGAGGYTSDEAATSLTETGRIGEAAFQRLTGSRILHPPGKGELSPLDAQWDGYGFEVKSVWTDSSRFAAWPKPYEIEQKLAAAEELGVKPALSIVVMDRASNTALVYYRDGLAGGRLSRNKGWRFMGRTTLTDSEVASAERMAASEGRRTSWASRDERSKLAGEQERPTPAEADAIEWYAGSDTNGSFHVNSALRGSDPEGGLSETALDWLTGAPPRLSDVVANIDAAVARGTITKGGKAYRGVSSDVLDEWGGIESLAGKDITDNGFMSLTTSREHAIEFTGLGEEGGLTLAIEIPEGTNALSLADIVSAAKAEENEILLPRGARIHINTVVRRPDGTYIANAELVGVETKTLSKAPPPELLQGATTHRIRPLDIEEREIVRAQAADGARWVTDEWENRGLTDVRRRLERQIGAEQGYERGLAADGVMNRIGLDEVRVLRGESDGVLGAVSFDPLDDARLLRISLGQVEQRLEQARYDTGVGLPFSRYTDEVLQERLYALVRRAENPASTVDVTGLVSFVQGGEGALLRDVAAEAAKVGRGVSVEVTAETRAVYEQLGMAERSDGVLWWRPEQAKSFAETGKVPKPPPPPPPKPPLPVGGVEPVDRPFAHYQDNTLSTQIARTRARLNKVIEKDGVWTTAEREAYDVDTARLMQLQDEKRYRSSLPKRPHAHVADAELDRMEEAFTLALRAAEKLVDDATTRQAIVRLHDELRMVANEKRKRGTFKSKRGADVDVKAVSERVQRLQQAYANRPMAQYYPGGAAHKDLRDHLGQGGQDVTQDGVYRSIAEGADYELEDVGIDLVDRAIAAGADVAAEVEARLEGKLGATMVGVRRNAIREVIADVRPMGATTRGSRLSVKSGDTVKSGGLSGAEVVHKASEWYPEDWLRVARARFDVKVTWNPRRGHWSGTTHEGRKAPGEIVLDPRRAPITSDVDGLDVAVHELGHTMEEAIPGVKKAEAAFYRRRTEGLKSRTYKYGDASKNEVVREDSFVDEYMGKDYGNRRRSIEPGSPESADLSSFPSEYNNYELLTMGVQLLFTGGRLSGGGTLWERDPEMRNFILGLLVTL